MTIMGDATHANVPFLARVPGLGLAGGYNTGTPDIQWTDADWAMFPGIPHIIIDQAYGDTNVAEAHAIVFDVEGRAFSPSQAAALIDANTTVRPTIYVNQSNMAQTIVFAQQSANWKGDVWLAFPGWQPGQPLPPLPAGCRYVAIQNQLDVNGLYDLSEVLDPYWPEVNPMLTIPGLPAGNQWLYPPTVLCDFNAASVIVVGQGTDGGVYMTKATGGVWAPFVKL